MSEIPGGELWERFMSLIETVDVAETLSTPVGESINQLLRLSCSEIGSEGASVLLREGEEGSLRFVWAIGRVAGNLIDMTIPSGKGIAGFVFSSGQPLAVSDAEQETGFYAEVDKSTGFSTHTIMATPLNFDGETIGVLEYVNREGIPPFEPFSAEEMDLAAHYANPIAALAHAYEGANIYSGLKEFLFANNTEQGVDDVREWIRGLRETKGHKQMMDLAVLVKTLSSRGAEERRLCREILEAVLRHSDRRPEIDIV